MNERAKRVQADRRRRAAVGEIRATVRRLQRSGEYERYLEEDEQLMQWCRTTLAHAFALTDADVDHIVAHLANNVEQHDAASARDAAARAVRRARGDDDDGAAGVVARV